MKTAFGCKLLGAHQALSGIKDAVVLLHSVVGCNFGSMAFHFSSCHMTDVRQTCTVINDSDVVFSGEDSLKRALSNVVELYDPSVIFLVTGCVSDIIQDDIQSVARGFQERTGLHVIPIEAAGYRGDFSNGFDQALMTLIDEMTPQARSPFPTINVLGFGADDPRLYADLQGLESLLAGKVRLGTVFSSCTMEEIRQAPQAGLNLVFGRGLPLAQEMERRFGIPYACLDYPCGLTGAKELWRCLEAFFDLDYSAETQKFSDRTAEGASPVFSYLQALYGMPAAVLAAGARARGMASFLSRELGMEVELAFQREDARNIEDVYDQIRRSEAAVLFGSSFEQEIADQMGIPLLRFDYPVFDRVCLTNRPYIGAEGTLCLIEDMLNEVMHARTRKGALYQ